MKLKTLVLLLLLTFVASLTPAAHAQTFSVIHTFTNAEDGKVPFAGVTIRGNNLYGVANGGPTGNGLVYEILRQGENWGELIPLTNFKVQSAGLTARVVFGPDSHLYGTARGGARTLGWLFELMVPNSSVCKTPSCSLLSTPAIHFFTDPSIASYGALTFDQQGNFYGTADFNPYGSYVYQIMLSGNTWTENILHIFSGNQDGQGAGHGVIIDENGNLIGTTGGGGQYGQGAVFEMTNLNGQWAETLLHSFQGSDGNDPSAGLVSDNFGNLYGVTRKGGSNGGGTVFQLVPSDDGYTFKVLYNLPPIFFYNSGSLGNLAVDAAAPNPFSDVPRADAHGSHRCRPFGLQNLCGDATRPRRAASLGLPH